MWHSGYKQQSSGMSLRYPAHGESNHLQCPWSDQWSQRWGIANIWTKLVSPSNISLQNILAMRAGTKLLTIKTTVPIDIWPFLYLIQQWSIHWLVLQARFCMAMLQLVEYSTWRIAILSAACLSFGGLIGNHNGGKLQETSALPYSMKWLPSFYQDDWATCHLDSGRVPR